MRSLSLSKNQICVLVVTLLLSYSVLPDSTKLLSQGAISKNNVAFIYAEDLWVANLDGSNPRRLTIDKGVESNPIFSPDGKKIAFNAQYDGNNGQVAYVYVPNTADAGHQYFKRYFFPQVNKKAIIVDERYNGGGYLADYYIDLLNRPNNSYWAFRHGND